MLFHNIPSNHKTQQNSPVNPHLTTFYFFLTIIDHEKYFIFIIKNDD